MSSYQPIFHLLTVCGPARAADGTLDRLYASLSIQRAPIRSWLVTQGVDENQIARLQSAYPGIAITVTRLPRISPLAHSRNLVLPKILEEAASGDIIAFPDDDCWYANETLLSVADLMMQSGAQYLIGRLSPAPQIHKPIRAQSATLEDSLYRASSGTLFIRAAGARQIGLFDDRFGLGAPLGSAEDTDYAMRGWRMGLRGLITNDLQIGHPDRPERPAQYYRGNLALLAKHIKADPLMPVRLILRVARGAKYVWAGAIPATRYVGDCLSAFRFFFSV